MMEIVSTRVHSDRFDANEPDGWIDNEPYWLLNPKLHRESLQIDYSLKFIRYIVECDMDMYMEGI